MERSWQDQAFEFLAALHMSVRWELAPEVKKRLAELVETFPGPGSRTPAAPHWCELPAPPEEK